MLNRWAFSHIGEILPCKPVRRDTTRMRALPGIEDAVSKTVTGLTVASVEADGLIGLESTVADCVPELADSGWGPDPLRDLLDMRYGSEWNEDYAAPSRRVESMGR
jgi:hypothetical protein